MPKKPFSGEWARGLLLAELNQMADSAGVVAMDLASGEIAAVNPNRQFPAASVVKVPIAMSVLHQVTIGNLSLDDQITYQSATDYEGGAGSIQFMVNDGDSFPIRFLLDRMIRVSDNIARNMLERYIGSDTIRAYMTSLGVEPPYYAPFPMMTSRGANTVLSKLDSTRAGINSELTRFLIDLMSRTVFNDRIPAKLPPEVTVAHKVGSLGSMVADSGLVYAPDRSFAISVFTENLPYDKATNLIANLAAKIYYYEDWLVTSGEG